MTVEERSSFLKDVQDELQKIADVKGIPINELIYDFQEVEEFTLSIPPTVTAANGKPLPPPPQPKERGVGVGGEKGALERTESKLSHFGGGEKTPATPTASAAPNVAASGPRKLPCIPNVFAVVCDARYERSYPWGTCEVQNEEHSDFLRLQSLIFEAGKHRNAFCVF